MAAGAAAAIPVNIFIDMETADANGTALTTTITANGTHGTCNSWTVSGSMANFTVDTGSDLGQTKSSFSVSGTSYRNTSGTRGWKRDHSVTGPQTVTCNITTANTKASAGGWFNTNQGVAASFNIYDMVELDANANFCTYQTNDNLGSSTYLMRMEGGLASGTVDMFTATANTTYWVTMQLDVPNGTCKGSVYNTSGTLLAGPVSVAASTAGVITRFQFQPTQHASNSSQATKMDAWAVDWTTGTFPLGP